MLYITWNCLIFGLCPSSYILKTLENTNFRKLDLFSSSNVRETPTLLDPAERADFSHWTTYVNITRVETRLCQWELTERI
jgi:hypothetical protein